MSGKDMNPELGLKMSQTLQPPRHGVSKQGSITITRFSDDNKQDFR